MTCAKLPQLCHEHPSLGKVKRALKLRISWVLRNNTSRSCCLLLTESNKYTALLFHLPQHTGYLFGRLCPPLPNCFSALHILLAHLLALQLPVALD